MATAIDIADVEEWRVVPSQPQILASSHGRIKRLDHTGSMPNGGGRTYRSDPTFGCVRTAKRGAAHMYFGYNYRGVGNVKIHRMVCEAFHGPAPEGRNVVIHINENALDNRPENLCWGTQKENLNASGFRAHCRARSGERSPWARHFANAAP